MITCPICKNVSEKSTLKILESDCHFLAIEGINQHIVRYQCAQRNQLIDELDQKVVEIVQASQSGEELDAGKFIQRKHKTY